MKILFLTKRDLEGTGEVFLNTLGKEHDVKILDIREEKDYQRIIEEIEDAEKIISW